MNPHFWPNIILYYITLYYDNVYRIHSIKVSIQSHTMGEYMRLTMVERMGSGVSVRRGRYC